MWKKICEWFKKKVSKVRACCQSGKDDRIPEDGVPFARKRSKAQGVGGKPTNVKTFSRTKKSTGGSVGDRMIREAQKNYKGSFISGNLGGVKVSNPSLVKYYGKKIMP
jgi:hypothetical protein